MTSNDPAPAVSGRICALTCGVLLATPVLVLVRRGADDGCEVPLVTLVCAAVAVAAYVFAMPAKEITLVGRTDSWG